MEFLRSSVLRTVFVSVSTKFVDKTIHRSYGRHRTIIHSAERFLFSSERKSLFALGLGGISKAIE